MILYAVVRRDRVRKKITGKIFENREEAEKYREVASSYSAEEPIIIEIPLKGLIL